jgi:erythronate-4-phosphate dehydrogenase
MKVVADEKIPGLSHYLSEQFELELLPLEKINAQTLRDADILIGRSVLKVNQALLENTSVRIVATCSSGTDHIDGEYLNKRGVKLFSAPGSNAQGVADYILWMLAYCEKQGVELKKNAGIIGAGHVGTKVQSVLETLGFNVIINDPPKASKDSHFISADLMEIAQCDLICVHAALTKESPYPSYHLLSESWWKRVKKNTVFINAARGAIVDTAALLQHNKNYYLCLDVFENEPNIDPTLIQECLMATPHIAGHTIESFYRATKMVVEQIHECVGNKINPPCTPLYKGGETSHEDFIIDVSQCRHWYDVILKYYNFSSKVDLTPTSFYNLREMHRIRHDFSAMIIQNSHFLPESDRALLKRLQMNLEDDHGI